MNWNDLLSAFALVLILEGLMPFISPSAYKKNMAQMLQLNDKNLRVIALGSMLVGVFFLYLIRS